jgi:hypothetical protein
MQASLCAMSIVLKQIEGDDPLLASATAQLSLAVDAAGRYHQLLNSIFWKTAKPTVKKSVRCSLNSLAYDTYSALMEAVASLDRYRDIHHECSTPPIWWNDAVVTLTMAHDALQREHGDELNSRQLSLFQNHVCIS